MKDKFSKTSNGNSKALIAAVMLVSLTGDACATGVTAGLSCSSPAGMIGTQMSDAQDDLVACIGGVWHSMIYGKSSFPLNHPVETNNIGGYSCSAYTDASGNVYLNMIGAYSWSIWTPTHILLGMNGGTPEVCMADYSGISLNAGNRTSFVPW